MIVIKADILRYRGIFMGLFKDNPHLTRRAEIGILIALVFFALIFIFAGFLERPALWFDEGINIEIARNFALFGELDVIVAPDTFSGLPYFIGSNGYPLTIPLGAFFKIFGVGLLQARIFMLFWFFATLAVMYLVTRKLFGVLPALSTIALVVSFASVYGNGLTATGEMPGLFFFIFGLWFLLDKKNYFATGIVWGIAMAAKPGIFLLLAHTMVLYILFADRTAWFKKICTAGLGFLIPITLWILLVFPLTPQTLYSVVAYALNPIDIPIVTSLLKHLPLETFVAGVIVPYSGDLGSNVAANAKLFVTHSTLIYFFILAAIVFSGLFFGLKKNPHYKGMLCVIAAYGLLTLFYFMRGPGWFRYLLALQILLFIPLFPALLEWIAKAEAWLSQIQKPWGLHSAYLTTVLVSLLFMFQSFQLYFFSNIPDSKGMRESVAYIQYRMEQDPKLIVGLYNAPEVAAFTDPSRTYHYSLPQMGYAPLGESSLRMELPPDIVVVNREEILIDEIEREVLATHYRQIKEIRKFNIYEKVPL